MTATEARIVEAATRYAGAKRHIKEMGQEVIEAARVECTNLPSAEWQLSGVDRCMDTFVNPASYDYPSEKRVWFENHADWPKYCVPCRAFAEAAHARHLEKRRLGGLMRALLKAAADQLPGGPR